MFKTYISFKKDGTQLLSVVCLKAINYCHYIRLALAVYGLIGSTYLLNDYIFRCASHVSPECNLGVNRVHILPPVAICPIVLDRQHSVSKEKLSQRSKNSHEDRDAQAVLVSFFPSHFMIKEVSKLPNTSFVLMQLKFPQTVLIKELW